MQLCLGLVNAALKKCEGILVKASQRVEEHEHTKCDTRRLLKADLKPVCLLVAKDEQAEST